MVVIGAVLLVLAALVVLGTIFTNSTPTDLSVFGVSVSHVSVAGLFVVGLVTGAVAVVAVSLLLRGLARKRHRRVEGKRERQAMAGSAGELAEENARLRTELDDRGTGGGLSEGGVGDTRP